MKINTGTDHIKQWFVPVALQWQYEGNRAAVFIAFQDFYFATMLSGNFIYEREPIARLRDLSTRKNGVKIFS